jgi:hypothetical protein
VLLFGAEVLNLPLIPGISMKISLPELVTGITRDEET